MLERELARSCKRYSQRQAPCGARVIVCSRIGTSQERITTKMEGSWLDQFRGQHVTVLTNVGADERSDTGDLIQISDGWLQLVKDSGDMVLIPSSAIRQVKLLKMTHMVDAVESATERHIDNRIYEPNAQTI